MREAAADDAVAVLIVEDERTIAENLYDYLEAGGYRCDYAASLAEALRRSRAANQLLSRHPLPRKCTPNDDD